MNDEEQGTPLVVSTEGIIISHEIMTEARDAAFENANRHRQIREGAPFEGRAQAIGACQMNMTGMIVSSLQAGSIQGPAQQLAGAAIYALATHLAVMEKVEQEKRDAAKRSGSIIPIGEAERSGTGAGDSAGANVRRPAAPDSSDHRGVGEDS